MHFLHFTTHKQTHPHAMAVLSRRKMDASCFAQLQQLVTSLVCVQPLDVISATAPMTSFMSASHQLGDVWYDVISKLIIYATLKQFRNLTSRHSQTSMSPDSSRLITYLTLLLTPLPISIHFTWLRFPINSFTWFMSTTPYLWYYLFGLQNCHTLDFWILLRSVFSTLLFL